ncbi:MAG: adenylosuccinate synthetase, partial [Nanoarchaeota archaeon]
MVNSAFIVTSMCFGSEGKGSIVDSLTQKFNSDLTVRFSGAHQTKSEVITKNKHHSFCQFGSGTLSGARTLISKYVIIDPLSFDGEERNLQSLGYNHSYDNIFIDEDCLITTPFAKAFNRLLEISRGKDRHGSSGLGCYATLEDSFERPKNIIRAKDLLGKAGDLFQKLEDTRNAFIQRSIELKLSNFDENFDEKNKDEHRIFNCGIGNLVKLYQEFAKRVNIIDYQTSLNIIKKSNYPIFEGNQGVLLDDSDGFYPYVTANSSTSERAVKLLLDAEWGCLYHKIGVTRPYF